MVVTVDKSAKAYPFYHIILHISPFLNEDFYNFILNYHEDKSKSNINPLAELSERILDSANGSIII